MTFFPPEWAPHDRVWIGFPGDPAEWPADLAEAQAQIAAFADAVHAGGKGEAVHLIARNGDDADRARALVSPGVNVDSLFFGDIWLRDTGPIVLQEQGRRVAQRFAFNGWGGSFDMEGDQEIGALLAAQLDLPVRQAGWILEGGAIEVDGTGLLATTEQVMLNPNRNPKMSKADITAYLKTDLAMTDILWLGDGLLNDHTDGHIDNLARFVAPGVIAIPEASDENDPNITVYADAAARALAHGLTVAPAPSPGRVVYDGVVQPASYMNFYIGNAAVVVPIYGRPNDQAALSTLADLFPGRKVVGVRSDAILRGGGSFHCSSQQVPSL